jgi:hypothetical protein
MIGERWYTRQTGSAPLGYLLNLEVVFSITVAGPSNLTMIGIIHGSVQAIPRAELTPIRAAISAGHSETGGINPDDMGGSGDFTILVRLPRF